MKSKVCFFVLLLLLKLNFCNGQKNTYLGMEAAASHDIYDIIDNGNLMKDVPLISGYFGLNIRQEFKANVFLETGLLRKYYYEGVGFKTSSSYASGNAINTWLIPIRLGTRINIRNRKLYLVPVIGYAFGINSDYGYGDGGIGGFRGTPRDTIYYSVFSNLNLRRRFSLLQTGLGLEFALFRTAMVSFAANYYTGLKDLIEQDITYTYKSGGSSMDGTGKGLSRGDMVSFGLAVKYPVSRLWNKK